MVFKVKKRAKYDYYQLTDKSIDNNKFSSNLNRAEYKNYSYNWPHDFFSLIELVNIDATITSNFKPVNELITNKLPEILKESNINNNLNKIIKNTIIIDGINKKNNS